ncbi:MAG: segregation and condensation protein A [Coriobacteriales bacterium]|jgi:segregation and condensation protein A
MSYRVKIESFEGPFELLLSLVTQQKVKIGSISVSEIADQYMDHVREMERFDMDVASEFLVVASTLLNMKAQALLPLAPVKKRPGDEDEEETGALTLVETANLLAARILTYYQYKRVAAMLGTRMQSESMMHPRTAGPDAEFLGRLPDYLENVSLEGLGLVCATLMARRETFLLDAEHIAAKPIAVETYVTSICDKLARLQGERKMQFSELVADAQGAPEIVVSFLAILEMYKRGMIDLHQSEPGQPIDVIYNDPSRWSELALHEEGDGVEEAGRSPEERSNDTEEQHD